MDNKYNAFINNALQSKATIITVAGAGGGPGKYGCNGPNSLYHDIALIYPKYYNMNVIRVIYHSCGILNDAIDDLNYWIQYAIDNGEKNIYLIGWSMGSAVIIESANKFLKQNVIKGMIFLAGQTAKTNKIENLDHIPKLFIHGNNDTCLSMQCSYTLNKMAHYTGSVIILENATHAVENSLPHINIWFNAQMMPCILVTKF